MKTWIVFSVKEANKTIYEQANDMMQTDHEYIGELYDYFDAAFLKLAENGGYPPTQNGDIRSLFWLFSLMALQN